MRILIYSFLIVAFVQGFLSAQNTETSPNKPVDSMALLRDDKVLKVGDQIQYMVTEDREQPVVLFIDEKGQIEVPLLGSVFADGKTPRALAVEIRDLLLVDYYYQATVHISLHLGDRSRGQVFILGSVVRQGPIDIPRGEVLTVSKAILRAGGFGLSADPTRVNLVRRDPSNPESEVKMEVNVAEILDTGRLDKDPTLQANDMIFVGRRGDSSGKITVTGAVRSPGVMVLPGGSKLTISQCILQSGGFTEFANKRKVKIVRYEEDGERREVVVDVEEILEKGRRDEDIFLRPEDMIIVPEKWISF